MTKLKSTAAILLTLAALITPSLARIGEDQRQLEARYGKVLRTLEGADGSSALSFQRKDLEILATLRQGKCQVVTYRLQPPNPEAGGGQVPQKLGEDRIKALLSENAPAADWTKEGPLHLAKSAKLEAQESNGVLTIRSFEEKARAEAAKDPAKKEAPGLDSYIGLSVEEAGQRAKAAGLPWRVIMEDGVSNPVTLDFSETRLNFTVVKGKVTAVKNG